MSLIEHARAHFTRLDVRVIEVPEWAGEDGQPAQIYCRPLTLAEKSKLSTISEKTSPIESLAHLLIMKCEDAQGAKLFTLADKHALMNGVDPAVVARIATEISRAVTVEDAEKN